MAKNPTKDPKFQKVVHAFLTTKPQSKKATGKPKAAEPNKHGKA
jgi:hypothetical protein